uniref:Putative BTB_POZ domain and WD-repeat protein n=1 Tax=Moumouvirus sp. 'Monve' TaxID=1128131 RepID=H2ED24_9VIRU|nr:putative BTB_POZ domain and WD-repeat protein [Moumouvirus Monve]
MLNKMSDTIDVNIISGSRDKSIKLWNIQNSIINNVSTIGSHNDWVHSVNISPDKSKLISGSYNISGSVKIWDMDSFQVMKEYNSGGTRNTFFSPDGKNIIYSDNNVHIYDLESDKPILEKITKQSWPIRCLAYSPDGRMFAISSGKCAKIYDIRSSEKIKKFELTNNVGSFCFSPDINQFVTGDYNDVLSFWDFGTDKLIVSHDHNNGTHVYSINYSEDGKYAISGHQSGQINIWNSTTFELLKTWKQKGYVSQVKFIDNQTFVSGSYDSVVNLWNIDSGKIMTLSNHSECVECVCSF